jgi:3-oxoadipate enol-lactonase
VYRLVRALGIDTCYLAGHSMGGMIAQLLILDHPDLFPALILVDTAAEIPEGMRSQERARLLQIAQEQGMEAVFEEQLRTNPQAERLRAHPQLLEVWRQQFLLTSLEAYLYCARAMTEREPLLDRLGTIKAPTLIVCGQNDEPFLRPSQHMNERIGGSELAIIPGAGHTPQIEAPAEFNRVLSGFLTRVHQTAAAGG